VVVHKCCDHTTKSQETLKMESENEMVKMFERNEERILKGGIEAERNERR
jgi:hypothetical protein